MFGTHKSQGLRLQAGLSVALLALMTGMAQAQDATDDPAVMVDPIEVSDDGLDVDVIDPSVIDESGAVGNDEEILDENGNPDEVFYLSDGIGGEGEPIIAETQGESDGEPVNIDGIGDGEPLDPEMGPTMANPDSVCDGCEAQSGGPEVQRTISVDGGQAFDPAQGSVRNDANICYDADLYMPLLCDWQRPFVGDKMP